MPPFKTVYDPQTRSLKDTSTGAVLATGNYSDVVKQPPKPQTTEPASSAVPVVSATIAKNLIQNEIKPALDNANTSLSLQQQRQRERSIALSRGEITDQSSMDAFKKKQEQSGQPEQQSQLTPEQEILNTPESGYKWAYQRDGTRVQIPINSFASNYGMFDVKPVVSQGMSPTGAGKTEDVPLDDGSSAAQFSDGTYGNFDAAGNFIGTISKSQYDNLKLNSNIFQKNKAQKSALEMQEKIDQIINGTYPLSPDQQAQIESAKQVFQRLIDQQTIANKNFEGGVTVAQTLSGMSEYSPLAAQGALKSAVDSGISKISELNSQLINAVTKMNIAFRSDNMEMLEKAYNMYNDYANKKQEEIDKITDRTISYEKDMRDYNLEVEKFQEKAYYDDLSAKLASDTLTLNEKKALMEDERARATLSETSRHNLAMELNAQEQNQLKAAELYGNPTAGDTPFAATINIAKQFGSTNVQRKSIENSLSTAANSGDWKTFYTQLTNAADQKVGAKAQGDIIDARKEIAQLSQIEQLVQQYQQMGGDMGYLKGTFDQVMTRFGQLAVDPQFKDIANQMNRAFMTYRQVMTGAAFGAKENAEYKSVYPGPDNTIDLNLSKVTSAKRYLETNIDAVYSSALGEGYENVKGLVALQDKHDKISQLTPQAAMAQMAQLKNQYPDIVKEATEWMKQPTVDGEQKSWNDGLLFTMQRIGI